jgi:hypothetical protein
MEISLVVSSAIYLLCRREALSVFRMIVSGAEVVSQLLVLPLVCMKLLRAFCIAAVIISNRRASCAGVKGGGSSICPHACMVPSYLVDSSVSSDHKCQINQV